MLMTKTSKKWLDNSEGKQYNTDLSYGFQCYDYANAFFMAVTGERLYGLYAKNIPFDNASTIKSMVNQSKTTIVFTTKIRYCCIPQ